MDNETFFTKRLSPETSFPAGMVSVDIVKGSNLTGANKSIGDTRDALKAVVEAQILDAPATCLPWRGDGGIVVFDISAGADEMVMFADRIRHLVPFLNRTRGRLNKLYLQQTFTVRIVCHSGELFNSGTAGGLVGDALSFCRWVAQPPAGDRPTRPTSGQRSSSTGRTASNPS